MKDTLKPNIIYQKILQNEITLIEGIEYLISIIEKSEKANIRLSGLDILRKLKTRSDHVFKILENCIISDENEEIRIISAKIILELYGQEGIECLAWALLNDRSSKFLKSLGKILSSHVNDQYENLYSAYLQRLNKIANRFEISPEEVPFLLDLEFNLNSYNSFNWSSSTKLVYDGDVMFRIKDHHIIELTMSLKNELPISISSLRNLKVLDLRCNNLTDLPNSLSDLKHLESLDLSWNDFRVVPSILNELKTIKKITIQYNLIHK